MKSAIESALKLNDRYVNWQGVYHETEIMSTEYNLEIFYYERCIKNEEYFKQALKNDGLTEFEIINVLAGKYVKDEKILALREKQVEKKNIRKKGVA